MEILFQLLLKGCTIEAISENRFGKSTELFQLLLISLKYANGLRNGANSDTRARIHVVERMYD